MKIQEIKIEVLKPEIPISWTNYIGHVPIKFSLVRVLTDEKHEGDCMIASIHNTMLPHALADVIESVKHHVIHEDPLNREKIYQNIGVEPWRALRGPALSAIDIALWDIAGKSAGLPLYKLLGGFREKMRAYISTTNVGKKMTIEDFVTEAVSLKKKGFTAMKIHYPACNEEDIEACKAVREAVGDEMDLMLDPTYGYDRRLAIKVGRAVEKLGFYWYEAPLPPCDIDGYVNLSRKLDIPIALEVYDNASEYLSRRAIDLFRDLGDFTGGITHLRKTQNMCELFGVGWEPHSYGSTTTQAAHLHVMCATKNCDFFEYPHPEGIYDIAMKDTIRLDKEGYVHVPQKPGLGVDIDWDEVRKLTVESISIR